MIGGIALGVVIVEAVTRPGSLITARLAGKFGRLVFAVPGSPLDPRCHGTNGPLKDGAVIVTTLSRQWRRHAGGLVSLAMDA
jgi:DNA processing protein